MFPTSSDDLVLEFDVDSYNGVIVSDSEQFEKMDELLFGRYMKSSLKKWRKDKRRGVWLRVKQMLILLMN